MKRHSLVLDANLLILYIVGCTSRAYISKHKKLAAYSEIDFDLLCSIIMEAQTVIVTPNTLTEASNMIRYIGDPARTEICHFFREMIQIVTEEYRESKDAAGQRAFLRLGLTDSILLCASQGMRTLLTSDLALYLEATSLGVKAINFNHFRDAA